MSKEGEVLYIFGYFLFIFEAAVCHCLEGFVSYKTVQFSMYKKEIGRWQRD